MNEHAGRRLSANELRLVTIGLITAGTDIAIASSYIQGVFDDLGELTRDEQAFVDAQIIGMLVSIVTALKSQPDVAAKINAFLDSMARGNS